MRPVEITKDQIRKIRTLHGKGQSQRTIAASVGLSQFSVFGVIKGYKPLSKPKSNMFNVKEKCWLTGWSYNPDRYREVNRK